MVKGAVGEGVAIPFLEFLNSLRLADPVAVLDGLESPNMHKLNDSEIFVLFGSLNQVLKDRMADGDFYKSALTYFDLVQEVIRVNRRDLIFVSLKEMVGTKDSSNCLLYTSPSPRDATLSRMPSSA